MKFTISLFTLCMMISPVMADEFGARFADEAPSAFGDPSPEAMATYRAETLQAITPAAGDSNEELKTKTQNISDKPLMDYPDLLIEELKRLEFK